MTLSLPFLAPNIGKAAIEARLLGSYGLKRLVDLPMAWSDQWQALGRQPQRDEHQLCLENNPILPGNLCLALRFPERAPLFLHPTWTIVQAPNAELQSAATLEKEQLWKRNFAGGDSGRGAPSICGAKAAETLLRPLHSAQVTEISR
jgi:hypothetical protein